MALPSYVHPQSAAERQEQIDRLDALLIALGNDPSPQATLTLEHLAGVRTCLIDFLPAELSLNMDLAEASLANFPDQGLKSRIHEFLNSIRARQ